MIQPNGTYVCQVPSDSTMSRLMAISVEKGFLDLLGKFEVVNLRWLCYVSSELR